MQFHLSTLFLVMLGAAGVLFLNLNARTEAPVRIVLDSQGNSTYLQDTHYGYPWAFYSEGLLTRTNREGQTIWVNPDGPQWGKNYRNLGLDAGLGLSLLFALGAFNEIRLRRRERRAALAGTAKGAARSA